jgi:hypothetical protein
MIGHSVGGFILNGAATRLVRLVMMVSLALVILVIVMLISRRLFANRSQSPKDENIS